mmetsp:Transcript_18050/g.50151  ORF Transcript_18050/g.50151 Transcript_18050/m.50151 type:complete len:201 (+) Transcript_18050:189-791(+)|eukprot:CAMPEP_0172379342 /NCGR_PEP_ID=MMETSP1060-20121228/69884_1 /TAXON_ID=37318 /ORGANISM="Pseudo-nitzschia pungens, Strain cf. cingulata" /LENGTH=200 /DNA_ID=CAMNT_0013107083 /DNA_START=232 /DNA_END=834 /DNA_ORIENTATION=-
MTAINTAKSVLSLLIALIVVVHTSARRSTRGFYEIGCAMQCQDHTGDPVDVDGVDFADLVSLYLDNGNSTNSTGNFTDLGNSTDNDAQLIYGDIGCWDVSEVTDMSGAFAFQDEFNTAIGCWDVSSVTDMSEMFLQATSFNQDMNIWANKVPRDNINTEDMFVGSGCDVTSDPDTIGRPWCRYRQPQWSPQFECFFFKKC